MLPSIRRTYSHCLKHAIPHRLRYTKIIHIYLQTFLLIDLGNPDTLANHSPDDSNSVSKRYELRSRKPYDVVVGIVKDTRSFSKKVTTHDADIFR